MIAINMTVERVNGSRYQAAYTFENVVDYRHALELFKGSSDVRCIKVTNQDTNDRVLYIVDEISGDWTRIAGK